MTVTSMVAATAQWRAGRTRSVLYSVRAVNTLQYPGLPVIDVHVALTLSILMASLSQK